MFLLRSSLAALLAFVLLAGARAEAQGLLQDLFGAKAAPAPGARPSTTFRYPKSAWPGILDLFEDEAPPAEPAFRTVCVRMCDGYYFPISFSTTRRGFAADAQKCASSCKGAQLFFHPNPGGEIASARDFSGLQYDLLPNAFKYRKTLVEGCQCKPEPWADEERRRHEAYAASARKPVVQAAAPTALPAEPEERPLAVLRRGEPERSAPVPDRIELEQSAPPPAEAAPPRQRPQPRKQTEADLFAPVKSILFGAPAKPPRR